MCLECFRLISCTTLDAGTNVTHVLLDSASKRSIVNELSDGYMAWKPAELMGCVCGALLQQCQRSSCCL